jgi:hypothetical protein
MKHFSFAMLSVAACLALAGPGFNAQQVDIGAATQAPAPSAAATSAACAQTRTICVMEAKHHTKTVYACKSEEYCLPHSSLLSLLWGKNSCDDGRCSDVRIKHRLIVKKVDAPDTSHCVPQVAPVQYANPNNSAAPCLDPQRLR